MKDLLIKLRLDRTQAAAAAREHIADARRMADANREAAAEQKKGIGEILRDERGRYSATGDMAKQSANARVAEALSVGKAEKETNAAAVKGAKAIGESGGQSFARIGIGIGVAQQGLRALIGLAQGFGDAMSKAAENSKRLGSQFASDRDKLGELATVMGTKPDNAFTIANARFNTSVGMRAAEGLDFRLAMNNSGQQFKGRTIGDDEYGQFEKQAAELTSAKGFDPKDTGDLAGSILGFKDRSSLGDKASEDALGKLNSGTAILGRGRGSNPVLVRQFSMLSAATLNEDSMRGTFQDTDEIATVISTMAEKHDAQAAEMATAAIRGMRDFDGRAGALLAKAGVDHQTKFIAAIKLIAPLIEAEAKESGSKVGDVLKTHFEDHLTRDAIGVAINRGVGGGIFADREKFGAGVQGPGPAMATIGEFRGSERGMDRKADAKLRQSETERAAEDSRVEIIRKQALASLVKKKQIHTTTTNYQDFVMGHTTFGLFGTDDQTRIDTEAMQTLNRRTPSSVPIIPAMDVTPEARAATMNRQIDSIGSAGGNWSADFNKMNSELGQKLDRVVAAIEANKPGKVPDVTPALPAIRPAVVAKVPGR